GSDVCSSDLGVESIPPAQPIQVERRSRRTGCSAVTRPPGLRAHSRVPSSCTVSSTGRRFATTARDLRATVASYYSQRTGVLWLHHSGRKLPVRPISTHSTLDSGYGTANFSSFIHVHLWNRETV